MILEPKYLGYSLLFFPSHQHGTGSEVEQQEQEPLQVVRVPGSRFTHCATVLTQQVVSELPYQTLSPEV